MNANFDLLCHIPNYWQSIPLYSNMESKLEKEAQPSSVPEQVTSQVSWPGCVHASSPRASLCPDVQAA